MQFAGSSYRGIAVVAAVWMLFLSGCGAGNLPTYPVEGIVEFEDGERLKFGNIEFYSPEHQINARGVIARDGTFTLTTYREGDGAVEGRHEIIIMQQVGDYFLANSEAQIQHDHGGLIDTSHFDYQSSGLSCQIEPGPNRLRLIVRKRKRQTEDGLPL